MTTPPHVEILLQNAGWLRGLARQMLSDRDLADDAVQETWLAALNERAEPERDRSWLARVLRNFALQRGRSESARKRREERTARPESLPSAVDTVARAELHAKLVRAVLALEEPHRTVILWRYFEELPADEIARRAGIEPATVRSRLSRAREKLRERLTSESGEPPERWLAALLPLGAGLTGTPVHVGSGAIAGIGSLVMSAKLVVGVGALALLVAVLLWRASRPQEPSPRSEHAFAAVREEPASRVPEISDPSSDVGRSVASTAEARATTAAIGAMWRGSVLGEDGRVPIEGARVAYRRGAELAPRAMEDAASRTREGTRTDVQGRFELPIPSDVEEGLWIEADGYFASKLSPGDLPGDGTTPIELVLAPLGTLELEIVDEVQQPHVELPIRYSIHVNRGSQDYMWSYRRDFAGGRSDPSGHVTIANLPCGMPIDLRHGERRLGASSWLGTVSIDSRERTLRHRVRLARNATLTGRLEHTNGEPAESLALEWHPYPLDFDPPTRAQSGADGSFELSGIAPKPGELRLGAPGTEPRSLAPRIGEHIDLGTIVVPELSMLSVRLTSRWADPENLEEALAGVEVRAMRDGRVLALLLPSDAQSVSSGELSTVVSEGPLELLVTRGGHFNYGLCLPNEVLAHVPLSAPRRDVEVVVDETLGALDVELGDPRPAAGETVRLRLYELSTDEPAHLSFTMRGRVNGEGRVRFGPLAPGRFQGAIELGAHASASLGEIGISAGRSTSLVATSPSSFTLVGAVRNAHGEPVGRATVSWRTMDAEGASASDEAGVFRIDGLTCGLVDVAVRHGDFGEVRRRDIGVFAPGETRVEFVLAGFATLLGRVHENGQPAVRFSIHAQPVGSNNTYNSITDENGAFRFDRLPGGRIRIWAASRFMAVHDLAAGESREIEIDLADADPVTFTRDGVAIDDLYSVRALAFDEATAVASSWRTGALLQGGASIDLPDGRVLFDVARARADSHSSLVALVERPSARVELAASTLTIEFGATWNGLLPRANLVSVEGRDVIGAWGGEIVLVVERAADGEAVVPCLPEGARVRLTGLGSRGERVERIVDVASTRSVRWP